MTRHMSSVHEEKKAFKCKVCDKNFSQKTILSVHMASVHEGLKAFKCELCDKRFSKKCNMSTHMSSVHERKKKVWSYFKEKSFSAKIIEYIHQLTNKKLFKNDILKKVYLFNKLHQLMKNTKYSRKQKAIIHLNNCIKIVYFKCSNIFLPM